MEVSLKKGKAVRFPLNQRRVRLGSGTFNDLTLDASSAATRQCELTSTATGYTLKDLSGNGTVVNGNAIVKKKLNPGDTIDFGELSLTYQKIDFAPGTTERAVLKTSHLETTGKALVTGTLSYKNNNKKHNLKITTAKIIGASKDAHIIVEDEFISSRHCQLIPHNNGMILRDLSSTNGTWMGQTRIMEVFLSSRAKFTAGKTEFKFTGGEPAKQINQSESFFGMIGEHPSLLAVQGLMKRMADLQEIVLITGETGTGKELSARAIHNSGNRKDQPFIVVNCAAISADLIESELFGHEKGAFTGAGQSRIGAFEEAGKGTIFLDEIGELPLVLQPKLLRTLDSNEVKPVGSSKTRKHKARVIAATNRNLEEEVRAGNFREDLYYRLNALPVKLPPLRERREDIPALARFFLSQSAKDMEILKHALNTLIYNYWPGNVRQLRNVLTTSIMYHPEAVERGYLAEEDLVINGPGSILSSQHQNGTLYHGKTIKDVEASLISEALTEYGGNKKRVCKALGISKSTLYDKIKKYELD